LLLSFKYRLKTSRKQIEILGEHLRLCRLAYNTFLGYCFDERKAGRGTPTSTSLNYLLPAMKARTPELEGVHSQVLQNVTKRVRSGFESYWNRRRAGLKSHLPRFRRADKYSSLTYPQSGFSIIDGVLKLSKIGDVKLIQHRPLEGRVKTLTVTRSPTGKWYALFSSEVEKKPMAGREKAVGLDLGLNSLVALSDGTLIEAPRSYRDAESRLRRVQRSLSRKRRGSRNREKARLRVASVCEKVANQRRDYAYKTARMIVNRYERVYVEDLKITNMVKNRRLGKSIGDAGWGMLRNALTYMAERSEGVTAFVNPRNTSQLCSRCGAYVRKDLSMRVHRCPVCGLTIDRDVNAALNVLKRGLEIGLEQAEYTPEGEATTTQLSVVEQAASMSQEAHLFRGGYFTSNVQDIEMFEWRA
jgi:putative transposase